MRQFETFINKLTVYGVTRDPLSWQTVTISGLPAGMNPKMVSVELANRGFTNIAMAARPTGETATDKWNNAQEPFSQTTVIHHLHHAGQLDFRAGGTEALNTISITAAWGGDAVKKFARNYPQATGWDGEGWREQDLTNWIAEEDRGNVEAVICFLWPTNPDYCDARGNGSSWHNGTNPPKGNPRTATIVPVDKDNTIEVYEGETKEEVRNCWAFFVGYILKGAYVNWDDGGLYRYRAILNPQDDNISTVSGSTTFDTYEVASKTMSPTTAGIYWRMQNQGPGFTYLSAREVGSTDPALVQHGTNDRIAGHVLAVDDNKEVEFVREEFDAANTASWIFGYLEEYIKHPQAGVMQWQE
jgi:hypothetical protein